jgi:hypothetical protein
MSTRDRDHGAPPPVSNEGFRDPDEAYELEAQVRVDKARAVQHYRVEAELAKEIHELRMNILAAQNERLELRHTLRLVIQYLSVPCDDDHSRMIAQLERLLGGPLEVSP